MTDIEHLKFVNNSIKENEPSVINKLYSEVNGKYFFIPGFEGSNKVYSLNSIYIEKNIEKSKQFFYNSARIAEYMSNEYDWQIIDSGIERISCALLSDNSDLIWRYSNLKNSKNHILSIGYQLPNAVQNVLQGNWLKLESNIVNLERFTKTQKYRWYAPTVNLFKGFLEKNKDEIETSLKKLLDTHQKRNKDPLICKFFSIDTAGLCKLAWTKGYEIDLKSSLVPIELMPIKPLEKYDDYDFLK